MSNWVCLSVCLSVCPLACLRNRMAELHNFCLHVPSGHDLQQVIYIQFCGCYHIFMPWGQWARIKHNAVFWRCSSVGSLDSCSVMCSVEFVEKRHWGPNRLFAVALFCIEMCVICIFRVVCQLRRCWVQRNTILHVTCGHSVLSPTSCKQFLVTLTAFFILKQFDILTSLLLLHTNYAMIL